jgi:ubiquinone/menaquinone biosynthesis C-methylase UbiE
MKRLLKQVLAFLLPIDGILIVNRALRRLTSAAHHLQFLRQWRFAAKAPESFDPFIDLFWRWGETGNPMSWERGVFGLLAMKPGCRQLDLCCGEGFYTRRFYALRAGSITAMDYNSRAIDFARQNFSAPNITYVQGDIRTEMPQGPFDNVSWDAGIEYFTQDEITGILNAIKTRLASGGTLSGYSILTPKVDSAERAKIGQKFAAASREALGELLAKHFAHVVILRTRHEDHYEDRVNHYFFASDGPLPFGDDWPHLARWSSG